MLEREGVLCTDCWQILEVNCISRSSILGHYLRHYRDSHVGYKKENKPEENSDEREDELLNEPVVLEFKSQWEQCKCARGKSETKSAYNTELI